MSNLDADPGAVVDGSQAASRPSMAPIRGRRASVGESTHVARYLPTRQCTTVGAWCFLDHYGPDDVAAAAGMQVGPHPHAGLQTVTWLLAGEVVHRDSLGTVQAIRPGQLNLMTAGHGIAHAEVSPTARPRWLHGLQLWVALPDAVRDGVASFEHHARLPVVDLGGARATVLVGELAGARSAANVFTPLVGADVEVPSSARGSVPLDPAHEHAVFVLDGSVFVEGERLTAGAGVHLGRFRRHIKVEGDRGGRLLLLGGEPFSERLVMWWNFVGRTGDEVLGMRADWEDGRRFGEVAGAPVARIPAPPLPPGKLKPR